MAFVTSTLSVGSALVTNVLVYRAIVRATGTEAFGALTLMLSLVGYLGMVDLGMNYGAARYLAVARAKDDEKTELRIAGTIFRINVLLMLAVGAVGGAAWLGFGLLPGKFVVLQQETGAWAVLVAWQAFYFPLRTFTVVLIARERQWQANLVSTAASLVASALALLLLHWGVGVAALPAANLIAAALGGGASMLLVGGSDVARIALAGLDRESWAGMWSFNLWATAGGLLWALQGTADQWVVAAGLGPPGAATLFLMYRWPLLAVTFASRISDSASPAITTVTARGDTSRAKEALHRVVSAATALGLLVVVGWTCMGSAVLSVWMPQIGTATAWMNTAFALAAVWNLPMLVLLNGWIALGRLRGYTWALAAQCVAKVLLLLVLVKSLGLLAAPVSLLASFGALTATEAFRLSRVGLLDLGRFGRTMLMAAAALAAGLGVAWLLNCAEAMARPQMATQAIKTLVATGVSAGLAFRLVLEDSERRRVRNLVRKALQA